MCSNPQKNKTCFSDFGGGGGSMEMISGDDTTVLFMDSGIPEQKPGVYQTFHLVTHAWPDINIWGWSEQICVKS